MIQCSFQLNVITLQTVTCLFHNSTCSSTKCNSLLCALAKQLKFALPLSTFTRHHAFLKLSLHQTLKQTKAVTEYPMKNGTELSLYATLTIGS